MYTYDRAVGISRRSPKGEELLDIAAVPCNTLFTEYSRLIIVVDDSIAQRKVSVDLQYYYVELGSYTGTIQEWLNTKTNVVLRTSNTLPGDRYRFVTTHDIQYENFSLLPGSVVQGDDRQDLLTTSDAPDIRIVKTDGSDVDYDALVQRCLWVINGHLTRAIPGNKCLFLRNAGKHFNVYDNIHVNALNFNTVSKLNTYPIDLDDIKFELVNGVPYLHVKSKVPLQGKTTWMSIGGRLYLDDVVQYRGNDSFAIQINKVDWFTAIFDSKQLIDLSSVIDRDRMVVDKDFFKTEEFFTNLLTDLSSFLIVLDNPHLDVSLVPMTNYLYPFTYHTEETRRLPILTGNGLLPKYFTRRIVNRRLLDIDIGVQRLYVNNTTGIRNEGNLFHGFKSKYAPSKLHPGYLLYIRGIIQGD
jgi:hypothetical protein